MDPRKISKCFATQQNTKAVATIKYFIANVKFVYHIFINKLYGKVL